MRDIEQTIRRVHTRLSADDHHRFRSWGHCYRYFQRRARLRTDRDLDQGALQLGFYLASWGMYRGSGFLIWKDYRVHRFAVRELLRPSYDSLHGFQPTSHERAAETIPQILALRDAIREAYCSHVPVVNGRRRSIEVTDTLASKIILGTLACIPAYDTQVVRGLRRAGLSFSELDGPHLVAMFDWYRDRKAEFRSVRGLIRESGLRYPVMKLVDMYLWQKGRRA